ncbi:MAG TPA: hypothetical protein VNA69_19975 [Thermoanaerobaculia bacterium]|nr:hypothetical protein [Thermoanaerobaculia bacterium]
MEMSADTTPTAYPRVRIDVRRDGASLQIGDSAFSLASSAPPSHQTAHLSVTTSRTVDPTAPKEIRSADVRHLAGDGSRALQQLLQTARAERERLDKTLAAARAEMVAKKARYESWKQGIFLKHLRKATYRQLEHEAIEATAVAVSAYETRMRAVIVAAIHVDPSLSPSYAHLCDAFRTMAKSERVWDTLAVARTNCIAERTSASQTIDRRDVKFSLSSSALMYCRLEVPHLQNANGGDLYLYPGFVLYEVSRDAFAIIDIRDVQLSADVCRFLERDSPPSDAEVVGTTWAKVNKDGSPDRRFRDNRQIPILKYAELTVTSSSGIHERYMLSNYADAIGFASAFRAYRALFRAIPAG